MFVKTDSVGAGFSSPEYSVKGAVCLIWTIPSRGSGLVLFWLWRRMKGGGQLVVGQDDGGAGTGDDEELEESEDSEETEVVGTSGVGEPMPDLLEPTSLQAVPRSACEVKAVQPPPVQTRTSSPARAEILGLIGSVDDNADLTGIATEIPANHILDEIRFPLSIFENHSVAYLTNNLVYSNKKKEFRNRMINIITRWKREVMYRKYMYALKREGHEVLVYHQEGNDDIDMGDDAVVDVNDDVFNDAVDVDVHDAVSPDVAPPIAAPSLVATSDVGDDAAVDMNDNVLIDDVDVDVHDAVSPDIVASHIVAPSLVATPVHLYLFLHLLRLTHLYGDDGISFYRHPFSLGSWLKDHLRADTRWLSLYHQWGGAKLKKEASAIIQSFISFFLDHTETQGAHGRLGDLYIYRLTQVIHNHVCLTTVHFKVELLNQDDTINARDPILLENDRPNFIGVLRRLVEGSALDYELEYLFLSLTRYSSTTLIWMKRFLCNYTGLWDGYERSSFFINFYARYVSDRAIKGAIDSVLTSALSPDLLETRSMSEFGWQCKIVRYSVFDHILRDSDQTTQGQSTSSIKYWEGNIHEIVRYIRACLQHFRQKSGGSTTDVRRIELELSLMFPNVLRCVYAGMCCERCFIS
ncbi:hypothetical protein RND81_10G056400 [Saponaria officinalis]|uniref:Uncharacterized protein n=1 Tax=Saponaria officinalis TaxID=3572 RepID=A0AAW1HYL1_SAPOF